MTGRELEAGVRGRLDNWKFWVGVAYFGLAAVVVALFFVNQRTQRAIADQQRAAGVHTAEIVANATSQYHLCLASIPELREINAFVAGVKVVHDTLLANSEALLAKTPRSSPLYAVRLRSLLRLRRAARAAARVKFHIPTEAGCKALRKRLLAQP